MDFSKVLDTIGPAAGSDAAMPRTPDAGLWRILEDFDRGANASAASGRAAYRQNGVDGEAAPDNAAGSQAPVAAPSLDPDDIAFELALDAATSLEDLRIARRLFARANHPDRAAPAERTVAARRMTIANALVDAAAARLSGR